MRRYLVIANQTLATHQLRQELLMRAEEGESLFHFLVPNTEREHYSPEWAESQWKQTEERQQLAIECAGSSEVANRDERVRDAVDLHPCPPLPKLG